MAKSTEQLGNEIIAKNKNTPDSYYNLKNEQLISNPLNAAKGVTAADWSDVDSKSSTLRDLASAFMAQYANGSDIANAQNQLAAAQFARNAARQGTDNFAELQNENDKLVGQVLSNTQQGTQQNLQQGQQASQSEQQAQMQKYAQDMQRIFANMSLTNAKKDIINQMALANAQGVEATQAMKAKAALQKDAIDLGIQEQNWNNTMGWIKFGGGAAEGLLSAGAGMADNFGKNAAKENK